MVAQSIARIDLSKLTRVNRAAGLGKGPISRAIVSPGVLAEIGIIPAQAGCKCGSVSHMQALGLPRAVTPGMPVADLVGLDSGCTSGKWICPKLDRLRERYRAELKTVYDRLWQEEGLQKWLRQNPEKIGQKANDV